MLSTFLESTVGVSGWLRWDHPGKENGQACLSSAEILQMSRRRMTIASNIVTMASSAFRVLEVVREAPFRVGMGAGSKTRPSDSDNSLEQLAGEVTQASACVVVYGKLIRKPQAAMPTCLMLAPGKLSFWIGFHLEPGPVA